jgi:hypothetical protein
METTIVDLDENRQDEVLVVAWVTTGAAIITVAIKLFTRAQIVKVIGWDDVFIVFSLVCCFSVVRTNTYELTTDPLHRF